MSTPDQFEKERDELIQQIRTAFSDVVRGDGVSLHETKVIDHYGDERERKAARRKDSDRHWWEVKDSWIESFGGVGGLSFLDEAGFRYYIPAYLTWYLRKPEIAVGHNQDLLFHLRGSEFRQFDRLFTPTQKEVIAKFIKFLIKYDMNYDMDDVAKDSLEKYWGQFLP